MVFLGTAPETKTSLSRPLTILRTHGIVFLYRCFFCVALPHSGEKELSNQLVISLLDFQEGNIKLPVVIQSLHLLESFQ